MQTTNKPKLSIILVTPNSYETVRQVIACYRNQSTAQEIELVLGVPNPDLFSVPEADMERFNSWKIIKTTSDKSIGKMKAEAVAQATAEIVVFGEDHAFPTKNWGEALIERQMESWAAVGPRVTNLNGGTAQTWAQAYMEYGPWMTSNGAGESPFLPGHNSSFKRQLLIEYGDELPNMLLSEFTLFQDLIKKGYKNYYEPHATIRHLNFEKFVPLFLINFYSGWQFAGWRIKNFSFLQRAIYILGSPAIPFLRFGRVLNMMIRNSQPRKISLAHLIYLGLNVLSDGIGQFVGYLFGLGNVTEKIYPYEFQRTRFVLTTEVIEGVCN